tara:strand:- start:9850 stop:15315 length:5466 start_codon:yes stop_codon:yes gene_type:complete
MPPYDRRARQRGFNTRIPIYTLSGGVGRQAPSKRTPSESQIIDNATPTLEKSIEKRPGSTQLSCYTDIASDSLTRWGALTLPSGSGAIGKIGVLTATGAAGSSVLNFNAAAEINSTLTLKSTDGTTVTYLANEFANSGDLTESIIDFTFVDSPEPNSTITLISADGTSKVYKAKTDGTVTNGAIDGDGNVQFNNGSGKTPNEKSHNVAKNLQEAIYSAQGHNNNASTSFEFSAAAQVDETITLTSTDGTEITYIGKSSGTSGDLSGSNVLFNVGASASASATALAAAINSTNGHNAVNAKATATWTFSAGPAAGNTIQLLGTTNLGTTVSKTFKAATSGSNGDLDGSDVIFLSVTNRTTTAANLAQAINNKNAFGTTGWMVATANASAAKATATLTFTAAATENATINIIDFKGVAKLYKAVSSPSATSTDFLRGTDRVASARAFADCVNTNHANTIRASYNSSGVVTLRQEALGTDGNTAISVSLSPGWAINCTTPAAFTGGVDGGDVTVTQAFGGSYGNTTITDSAGFASACSAAPPAAFTGGTSTGVNGTKFTTSVSTAQVTISQVAEGFGSTSRVKLSAKFTDSLSTRPSARLGKLHNTIIGKTGRVVIAQCVGGDTGNKNITQSRFFPEAVNKMPTVFSRSSQTYVNTGTNADDAANHLKTAVLSPNGHNGKITGAVSTSQVTLTQNVVGKAGNTAIEYNKKFSDKLSVKPTSFSNGSDYNSILDSKNIFLLDVDGKGVSMGFDSALNKSESTSKTIGTKDVTTTALAAESIAKAINATDIGITASYTAGTSEVNLTMDKTGGNGTAIVADDTYFKISAFRGSMPTKDLFYYWFSISDDLRYLLVIDYNAMSGSEKLFYIYKVNTETGKVEDQTPPLNSENGPTQPATKVYDYITYKNESKTAREALQAITVGTSIYIVNKFVKAGFSSSDNGYLFDYAGNETSEVDYKGKEVIYYTSSLVDPEGVASLYIPDKAYSAGTEVYTATGVWKAITDIRAETSNIFSATDSSETVTPADPGPPDYLFGNKNSDAGNGPAPYIWYPYAMNEAGTSGIKDTPDTTGPGRWYFGGTGAPSTLDPATMTPSVPTSSDENLFTWKETVKTASGIEEVEGDIVYDPNHSRRTCKPLADCGDTDEPTCPECGSVADSNPGVSFYTALWQYMRPVEQIPVQDNRYVNRVKQYLGQSLSDFSNVKLPPHPSDPTDIIDKVSEICDHPSTGGTNTNLTGDAARTIGILYEDKVADDYYDDACDSPRHEDPMNTHDYGLGKILFIENSYAGLNPGYYRIRSATRKPYITKIRTPFKHSRFDENRMPHKMVFTPPTDTANAGWNLIPEEWLMRVSGDAETNPGPKIFEEGKQAEIKAMGFFRNRLWLAGEDKVFSSKLNEINNMWIDDPTSLTDEDPIDITCSFNKYTEVISLTPFEEYLFVNTGSDVQFTLKGSDNQITPFTAEISPTSFYSTAPLVNPVLLGSQIYFFDKERLYVYFNDKTVSINNAIEVSYHCPGYLPSDVTESTVVAPYDTLLFIDQEDKKNIYCYTNRYSGEQVIQNAFFRYVYDKETEAVKNWDNDIYSVVKREGRSSYSTTAAGDMIYHIERQPYKQTDLTIPLLDHTKTLIITKDNTSFDKDKDETTFTFTGYYNDAIDGVVVTNGTNTNSVPVDGESLEIISTTADAAKSTVVVNGNYLKYTKAKVYVGTKFKTIIELSPQYYRDEANNVVDGILSLRTMHIRHHQTGNYRVEVSNRGRLTTPIEFSSKEISSRTDTLPLDSNILNGETVSKILGFGDEVKIQLISDYISPMNITNIELKGRFNATYSSWVR